MNSKTFFMKMNPPTATAQMKKVAIVHGKPRFYEPPKVAQAKRDLMKYLAEFAPDEPWAGAIRLSVTWYFPHGKSHKDREYRVTKPDTDNLQKMLKDCMTQTGFWKDDAQVVMETVMKLWSSREGIMIDIAELGESLP